MERFQSNETIRFSFCLTFSFWKQLQLYHLRFINGTHFSQESWKFIFIQTHFLIYHLSDCEVTVECKQFPVRLFIQHWNIQVLSDQGSLKIDYGSCNWRINHFMVAKKSEYPIFRWSDSLPKYVTLPLPLPHFFAFWLRWYQFPRIDRFAEIFQVEKQVRRKEKKKNVLQLNNISNEILFFQNEYNRYVEGTSKFWSIKFLWVVGWRKFDEFNKRMKSSGRHKWRKEDIFKMIFLQIKLNILFSLKVLSSFDEIPTFHMQLQKFLFAFSLPSCSSFLKQGTSNSAMPYKQTPEQKKKTKLKWEIIQNITIHTKKMEQWILAGVDVLCETQQFTSWNEKWNNLGSPCFQVTSKRWNC